MAMNLEGGAFARCARHPSQFFTGFCSSCLLERLSNVDAIERNPNPSAQTLNEIVEISTDSERNHNEVRERRTLLSLFQLDDTDGVESNEGSSCSGRIEEYKGLEERSESSGSSSWFPARGLKWRSASKRAQVEEGCFNCIIGAKDLERKHSLQHPCEWQEGRDDSKDRLEKSRHSWDGSMMSKALTCSFTCLDEPQDGSSKIRRGLPEASGPADSRQVSSTMTATVPDEKPKSPIGSSPNLSDVSRKKSHRWSRVWDWSITSPFRDFGKKREHVLERSLSNCWPESRSNAEPESGSRSCANGHIVAQTTQGFKQNVNGANAEIQRYRPDWPKKREYRFGRSRSVHNPSPRNVDNGLLRFYLTPMRTSRRSTNKGRTKTSRFLTWGLLGI